MKQLDPTIYSGVDRAERRRLARELAAEREKRDSALLRADYLEGKARANGWNPAATPGASVPDEVKLAAELRAAVALPPLRLMACGVCHRPVPQCTCGVAW